MTMPSRIYVKCWSEQIPGNPYDRRKTMANIMCEHVVGRDFDPSRDYMRSVGMYFVDGSRCQFLIDVGPRGAKEHELLFFVWDGENL